MSHAIGRRAWPCAPPWLRKHVRGAQVGQAFVEYALILAVMALVLALSLSGMASHLNNTFVAIADSLSNAGT